MTDFRAPRPYLPLPARLIVFLSGRGSNFEALASASLRNEIPGRIVAVVSDRASAKGLVRACELGIRTATVEKARGESREEHETRILDVLGDTDGALICLAGYMRLLSPSFVERFPLRILNIHPALLPSFPGTHAQRQALAYGCKVTGATVHFVDSGVDSGPIVMQEAVPILPEDDEDALSERILGVEHRLYAQAVRAVLAGGWRKAGRSVFLS